MPRYWRLSILLCFWVALAPWLAAAPGIVRVFRIETPPDFVADDLASLKQLDSFSSTIVTSLDDPPAPLGRTTWYKLELQQGSQPSRDGEVLRFYAAAHDRMAAYLVANDTLIERVETGFTVPLEKRRHHSTHLVIPLEEWQAPTASVYLTINTGQLVPLRAAVMSETELRLESDLQLGMTLAYFGGTVLLLLVQAALFLHFRDRAARDYTLVSLGFLFLLLAQSGHFDALLGGRLGGFYLGEWRHQLRLLNCVLGVMAFRSFFEFARVLPRFDRLLKGSALFIGFVAALSLTLGASTLQVVVAIIQLYAVGLLSIACVLVIKRRLIGAVLITAGWSGILLVTAYLNFVRFGLVPGWLDTPALPVAAVLWELFFNTVGLTYKFKRLGEIRHQKELRELELAGVERMVRVLCHDLSSPLATISMTTDLLQLNREAGRTVDLDATTSRLQLAVKSIKEIVDSVRNVELLKLQGGELALEPVDLCVAFDESERLVQDKLRRKRITLRKTDWPEFALVMAEPRMLRLSMIANALSNAVKFSPAGSVIDVAIRRDDGAMVLSVRDRGMGIPRELREAFARSGRIRSRPGTMNEEGTGFGVMLMRDFTQAMRGEFRLESRTAEEAPSDHGTTVEIRLATPVAAGAQTR